MAKWGTRAKLSTSSLTKYKGQEKRINDAISRVLIDIQTLPEQLEKIMGASQATAKAILQNAESDKDFTQKYGAYGKTDLAKHIVVSNTQYDMGNYYAKLTTMPTTRNEMWNYTFAEYGAGLKNKKSKDFSDEMFNNISTAIGYKPKKRKASYNFTREIIARRADIDKNTDLTGYWYFKDLDGNTHIVNYSKPLRFMYYSKLVMVANVHDLLYWKTVKKKKQSEWKLKYDEKNFAIISESVLKIGASGEGKIKGFIK